VTYPLIGEKVTFETLQKGIFKVLKGILRGFGAKFGEQVARNVVLFRPGDDFGRAKSVVEHDEHGFGR